jgi:hypothetical protein
MTMVQNFKAMLGQTLNHSGQNYVILCNATPFVNYSICS